MANATENELLQQLNDKKIREYAPAIAYSATVVFLGILGNGFTVAFYGFKVPRTTTNVIITSLSVLDLMTCVVISDEIIELCFTLTFRNVGGCKAMYFVNHTLVFTSALVLVLVSVDRCRRICRPFQWQLSIKSAKICLLVITIVSVLLSVRDWVILDVVRVTVYDSDNLRNVTAFYCTHSKADSLQTTITLFQITDFFVIVIGMVIMVVLYSLISYRLCVTRKSITREIPTESSNSESTATNNKVGHADRTVTLMLLTITIVCIISFLPYFIVNIIIKRQTGSSEQEFNAGIQTALRSYMLNNAINPYIIGLFNSKFRSYVKSLLYKCCFPCRK